MLQMFDRTGGLQHPYSAPGEPRTCEQGVADYVGDSGPELLAGDFQEGIRTALDWAASENLIPGGSSAAASQATEN